MSKVVCFLSKFLGYKLKMDRGPNIINVGHLSKSPVRKCEPLRWAIDGKPIQNSETAN